MLINPEINEKDNFTDCYGCFFIADGINTASLPASSPLEDRGV